ncbi:MAG: hypothetical protein EA401_12090 [Planctomycetota bacterium]|nr:MAG: hypothetical protein EA401_12090 [Planctomycetota bacterium]
MACPPTPYIFGAMSLGKDVAQQDNDIAVVRQVMEQGLWIHASPTYHRGFSFMALRCAFDAAPSQRPPMMLKIRDGSVRWLRFETEDCCRRLGLESIAMAQLVSMDDGPNNLIQQLVHGGPIAEELAALRTRGLIQRAAVFIHRRNCDAAVEAAAASPLIDAVTCYCNLWQRECSDAAWQRLQDLKIPVLALRTLAGHEQRPQSLADTAQAILSASGRSNLVQLAMDVAHTEPPVCATIGGTASLDHLQQLIACSQQARPLPPELMQRIANLRCAAREADS